ncbi:MAG: sulfotransferase [Myxococcota bacterium]
MQQRLAVRLFNAAQRLAQRLGRRPLPFADSEAALLEAARRASGLDDFGDAAFREPLRVLLRAYDEEARLSPFGRMLARQGLVDILNSRLLVQRGWRENPKALSAPIRRPVFILGLPRTGTTALHHLLACDPANQVLEYWLAAAPGPRPPVADWPGDPRYRKAVRDLRTIYYLDPGLKAIHLLTADGPEECRHLFLQSFLDDTFDSNATIPSYTKWFAQQDMRPAYARHRDVLRLIQAPAPERRWVLKYPAHLRHLDVLLETYPDACIVQTHRDPARLLPSLCSLVSGWRSLYEDGLDRRAIGRWQLEMWSTLMLGAMRVRASEASQRFFDLHFRELVADPIAAVRRLYARFDLELTPDAERRMRDWQRENPQGRHGEHRYSAEPYGISEGEIAERFAPYTDHFAVERELAPNR